MPYRKYKSTKRYSRPGYMNCGKMVYGDAKKALAVARAVKSMVNVELKNFDVQQTAVALTTTPVITQLSNIAQGDTTNSRDGAQVRAKSLEFSALINFNSSGSKTNVRLMLVWDKQTNQAIYGISDLLQDVTVSDVMVTPYNLDNKFRFSVIYDRRFNLTTAKTSINIKRVFRFNKILRYDASTPSIADLTSNSLSLVQWSNEAVNEPNISTFCRLRFVDN